MRVNPFFHRGPIRDRDYFFGRERLLLRIRSFLHKGQSVALVGSRRIGKTSIILRLIESSEEGLPSNPQLTCIYFDCERWGQASAEQIFGQLADAIGRHLADVVKDPAHNVAYQHRPLAQLESCVRQITLRGTQLVLMFDEFEALRANAQLGNDFFGVLRALAMEHGLAYLTVSTRPLLELTYARVQPRSSPFFNFFALMRVDPFARVESELLLQQLSLRGGCPFTPSFISQLIERAGDHPFFLQMLGDHAFERVAEGAAQDEALADALIYGAFRTEAADHWNYFWNQLSVADKRLLALFPVLAASHPDGVRRLEAAALVVCPTPGTPVLISKAFRQFVAEQSVDGMMQAPPITIDPALRLVLLAGRPLSLSPQQFELLAYLVNHRERVVPHDELAAEVHQRQEPGSLENLRTTLKELREILGSAKHCVRNVRGMGYQFIPDAHFGAPTSPTVPLSDSRIQG